MLLSGVSARHFLQRLSASSLSLSLSHQTIHSCIIHPEWVLWEHAGGANKDPNKWKENMTPLCSFKSIESFWQYFNHMPRPSEVFFDGDCRKKVGPKGKTVEEYSLFKKNIEPEWGDPENSKGGEWFCRQHFDADVLDLYWQNLVMAVVGESMDTDLDGSGRSYVNGVRVLDKSRGYPLYKFELWINSRDPQVKDKIRQKLMDLIVDGQPSSRKTVPKFDWKDHS